MQKAIKLAKEISPSKLECLEAYIEYNKNNYSAYTKVETAKILIKRERIAIRKAV